MPPDGGAAALADLGAHIANLTVTIPAADFVWIMLLIAIAFGVALIGAFTK